MASSRRDGVEARGSISGELAIEYRDRDHHDAQLPFGHRSKQVDIARDEVILRRDAERMLEVREHVHHVARDTQALFDRLVAIRVCPVCLLEAIQHSTISGRVRLGSNYRLCASLSIDRS